MACIFCDKPYIFFRFMKTAPKNSNIWGAKCQKATRTPYYILRHLGFPDFTNRKFPKVMLMHPPQCLRKETIIPRNVTVSRYYI